MHTFILLLLALLTCNAIYCGQHVMAAWRQSRSGQVAWGFLALLGAMMALVATVWAMLASLAHF